MLKLKELYDLATTDEQKNEFDNQWKTISNECGNHYFPLHYLEKPYLIKNKNDICVGTVTFVSKNNEFSIVDKFFDFTPFLPSLSNPIEIGKLSIKEEFRNQDNLKTVLKCILDVVRENKNTHIIGTINSKLYVALKRTYGAPIKKLSTVARLPKNDVLAIIINCEEMFNGSNIKIKEFF
jgi:hypothetical protein